jgi:hypothetical protein
MARQRAADLMREAFPRARKKYALVTAKKLSHARVTGGPAGEMVTLFHANPKEALRIAHWLLGEARMVVNSEGRCFREVSCEEQRADGREDNAQADALANESIETLDAYIREGTAAVAALEEAIDAARRRKRELEES